MGTFLSWELTVFERRRFQTNMAYSLVEVILTGELPVMSISNSVNWEIEIASLW